MSDPRNEKKVKVGSITVSQEFTDFESLIVVDTDGNNLTLEDEDGNSSEWPTGVPLSIGGPGPKLSSYLKVTSAGATYLIYQ